MRKHSQRIVVDASIAHSAGTTEHPMSSACRGVLDEMSSICHRVVFTQAILVEWRSHQSPYALRWQSAMQSRGKIVKVAQPTNRALRLGYDQLNGTQRAAAEKDIHLIEAALATDGCVISRDEGARKLFRVCCEEDADIRAIVWVNPCNAEEDCLGWLRAGAKRDPQRRLGTMPLS